MISSQALVIASSLLIIATILFPSVVYSFTSTPPSIKYPLILYSSQSANTDVVDSKTVSSATIEGMPTHSPATKLENKIYNWRGYNVRYQVSGPQNADHTLLLVHGLFVNSDHWRKMLTGLNTHLKCAEDELNQGSKNSLRVYQILTSCSWEKFLNFMNGSCSRYYLVDIIWGIFYGICIELPIVLIKAIFGIDLHIFVEIMYNIVVVPLDTVFFALSGYHLIVWSDDVIKKCYKCKGTWTLSNGQEVTMYKTFDEWGKMLDCGAEQLANGIMRAFTTILPTEKWLKWADDGNGKKYSTINSATYGNPNPNFWKPTVLGY